ncbi:alpha-L-rhamnosidase-related protein [Desertivirga arenae]|uniref:alpha-L-rhamnosidase-related protein n=1 Tax=Desertivirga arenae TaxID=2810309 RepID=UPI001A9653A1|nr:alpha-L-rhamnosidase C-terminal domain-containing protein [Pedobacter sp. SYSU D00823]
MERIFKVFLTFFILLTGHLVYGQSEWHAEWIAGKNITGTEYGVYHFRKTVDIAIKPAKFIVYVSADNRYKLYVNGRLVSLGPARGDSYSWNYETLDLAPYLNPGSNTVSALVFNESEFRPEAQVSFRTGFILQGSSPAEEILNTNNTWKCIRSAGHRPVPGYFFAASKGEMIDMKHTVKGDWTARRYDDSSWPAAEKIADGRPKGKAWGTDWALVPSTLAAREMSYLRIPKLRSATGANVPSSFPAKKTSFTIPANTLAVLLLDQTYETNAYITLNFDGGKDAGISIGYAETLYDKGSNGRQKSNRNEVVGKEFIGRIDSLIADGTDDQTFTTLNFRTYRYIRLLIHTQNEPLIIQDLYGTFTGYPFKKVAVFDSPNTEIKQILDIGWRTARLNAWETYTDCPYYEQLQYIGDTRIQAMISYYNTDDDRLARNALTQIDHSRLPEGVTRSCYPTKGTQVIPPFSLWYIGMLYDFWMYRNDPGFVKDKLIGVRGVLDFFRKYQQADGSLKDVPYWAFVDWAGNLAGEVKGSDGSAAIHDLQLLLAFQWAAQMEAKLGLQDLATLYHQRAIQLQKTIQGKYWDAGRKLYADTREKTGFSQHANALAILAGVVDQDVIPAVAEGMLKDKSLTQCTVYFKYYLNQALVKAGLGNDYMNWLDIWLQNMALGLTTWAEDSSLETVRSECHAWGSSPNIEFFRTVLGVDTDAPGFSKVRIKPHLGSLTNVKGVIPHPRGMVSLHYYEHRGKWKINIELPSEISGVFEWKAKTYKLNSGQNSFVL